MKDENDPDDYSSPLSKSEVVALVIVGSIVAGLVIYGVVFLVDRFVELWMS